MQRARVLIFAALLGAVLSAQSTGTLHGVLTDSSGAAIPGAAVQLSGSRSANTNADGSWSFNALAAGEYAIKVEYPGFGTFEKTVTIASGRSIDFPISLTPQASKQEVTVSAGPGVELSLDPGSNASGAVVSGSDLDALPDDPDDLADMLAQLAGPGLGTTGTAQILLDGFSGGQLPAKAAIKEIKVNQNPFSADYDNLGFGRIEIVTKPGADTLRGTFGLTDSDAAFNSRNPYADNKADYVNRMFTSNIAGPLTKKNSWNLNFQRNIIDNSALIRGITLDPGSQAEVPVRQSVTTPRTDYDVNARFDSQMTTNHTLTGTYRYYLSDRDNNGIGQYNLTSREYSNRNSRHEVRVTETAVLSANTVNETRFAFTRNSTVQFGNNTDPSILVAGAFNGGGAQVGAASNLNDNYEFQNNTIVVHSTHTIKFGTRARYNSITDISPANFGGTFSFFGVTGAPVLNSNNQAIPGQTTDISSLEQYRRTLIGAPGGGASQFSIAAGDPLARVNVADLESYVLDDWRATPNLTISAGLRYEVQTKIHDLSDWGPRLGVAWSPRAKPGTTPATVIRAGSGIFYNRVGTNFLLPEARFDGITQRQYVVQNPTFFTNIPSIATLAAQQQPITTYRLDPHERGMFLLFTALTVERQLPGKTTVSATWLRARGTHVTALLNVNAPYPGTYIPGQPASGVRPYGLTAGNIFEYEPVGVIDQTAAWVEVTNKINKKVSLTANYQYFIGKDDFSSGQPSNPYDMRADYGPSPWARPHNFTLFGTLTGLLGLQFSPFVVINSGAPYDLTIGTDLYGTTVNNARPAFATDLTRPSVVFTRFGAFDTSPIAGQTIVPRDYLRGTGMWNLNMRMGRTFAIGTLKNAAGEKRMKLNFNLDVNNIFNHLNQGGWVGNLSSPIFGQSTAIYLFRDTSNNRRLQLGTQFSF